jgi:hypothetical protein
MDIRTCGEPELDALNDRAKVWREQHSPKIRTELKTSRHTAAGQAPAKASRSGSLMGPPPSEAKIEGFGLPVWHSPNPFSKRFVLGGSCMKKVIRAAHTVKWRIRAQARIALTSDIRHG